MKQDMNCESNVWEYELLDWIDEEKIEKNPEKIRWRHLSYNPSIFKKRINYKYLYQRMNVIREELLMRCMHPSRLEHWIEMGGEIDDF